MTQRETCDAAFHVRSAALRRDDLDAGRWPVRGSEPCLFCRLPLGLPCDPTPANDTPDALVELRAAELSDGAASHATPMESFGWFDFGLDRDPKGTADLRDQWSAGWLGRAINEHDRRQP